MQREDRAEMVGAVMNTLGPTTTRRKFLRRSLDVALLLAAAGALPACGKSDESPAGAKVGGTITMMNYPDWIGKDEIASFRAAFPGADVKQVSGLTSGAAQAITQIRQNLKSYDLTLAGGAAAGQIQAAGLAAKFDASQVPLLSGIPEFYRRSFPYGVPVDIGKVGFGYRKDLIDERPESWADLWQLAAAHPRKVTVLKYAEDVVSMALLRTGQSANADDEKSLAGAVDALLELKRNVRAFLPTDFSKDLITGDAVAAVSYDYDIASAQDKNPAIVWVAPAKVCRDTSTAGSLWRAARISPPCTRS
ncbi:PotD/PotF family extracellular solute-binding protein [Amycolatopsis sp. EV170708-02-1]|uniref:ABC transporter substrate-binding protein n=1 Tax=Amycolatopsis sp. EV170708-02-1 TaxID=2919322 RepID=UPI001F0C291C|nr:extracellular solute-binding protein [Amycolatopsis sp. EV170708-02-1]UMP07485.1 extracellular solute-binding protein [Amycolatopsis sp. EV170708-02-1]